METFLLQRLRRNTDLYSNGRRSNLNLNNLLWTKVYSDRPLRTIQIDYVSGNHRLSEYRLISAARKRCLISTALIVNATNTINKKSIHFLKRGMPAIKPTMIIDTVTKYTTKNYSFVTSFPKIHSIRISS